MNRQTPKIEIFCIHPLPKSEVLFSGQNELGNSTFKCVQENYGLTRHRYLSNVGTGLPMTDKNRARADARTYPILGLGVWKNAPMPFPDSSSALKRCPSYETFARYKGKSKDAFWPLCPAHSKDPKQNRKRGHINRQF